MSTKADSVFAPRGMAFSWDGVILVPGEELRIKCSLW